MLQLKRPIRFWNTSTVSSVKRGLQVQPFRANWRHFPVLRALVFPGKTDYSDTKSIKIGTEMAILPVSTKHIKAARTLLGWTQKELALNSGISLPTVKRLEAKPGPIGGRDETKQALVGALENAGVAFSADNDRITSVQAHGKKHHFLQVGKPIRWNPQILDANIAQGFSEFDGASIPNLSEEHEKARHWTTDHILNRILRSKWPDAYAHLAFNFILRAEQCMRAYEYARLATETYLARRADEYPNPSRYFTTVNAWEKVIHEYQILLAVANEFPGSSNVFEKCDGSPEQRLREMNNDVKHALETGQRTPIWLSRTGINSVRGHIASFEEVSVLLVDLAEEVDILTDPLTAKKRTKKRN